MPNLTAKQFECVAAIHANGQAEFAFADLDFDGTVAVINRLAKMGIAGLKKSQNGWKCDLDEVASLCGHGDPGDEANGPPDYEETVEEEAERETTPDPETGFEEQSADDDAAAEEFVKAQADMGVDDDGSEVETETETEETAPLEFTTYGDLYEALLETGGMTLGDIARAFGCRYQHARYRILKLIAAKLIVEVDASPNEYALAEDYETAATATGFTFDVEWMAGPFPRVRSASRTNTTTQVARMEALVAQMETLVERLEAVSVAR